MLEQVQGIPQVLICLCLSGLLRMTFVVGGISRCGSRQVDFTEFAWIYLEVWPMTVPIHPARGEMTQGREGKMGTLWWRFYIYFKYSLSCLIFQPLPCSPQKYKEKNRMDKAFLLFLLPPVGILRTKNRSRLSSEHRHLLQFVIL